jgi:hypothetical protein
MALRFDLSLLADQIEQTLRDEEANLRLEQAVYGLDSCDESALQTKLAAGLARHYDVAREVHYPSTVGAKRSHRQRCDLVLSPKGFALRADDSPLTLFDSPHFTLPTDALWLEVKVAFQFREGGQRHPGYGAQWRTAIIEDLRKMEADPLIHEAGLLLVVFNESREILDKDLDLFESLLARQETLAGFRKVRSIDILERIGHRLCTISLWPTIQRG